MPSSDITDGDGRPRGPSTLAIHAGQESPRIGGAVNTPIFQSTVFELKQAHDYHAIPYPRLSTTPTQLALGRKIAVLENAELAFPTASGMAAITTAILAALGERGHLLVQDSTYGGTHSFVQATLPSFGHAMTMFDATDAGGWRSLLRPDTRAIYVEAMTNPLVKVADHRAVVAFAREHDLVAIVDATFATPINFRPLDLGYDVAVHSATKYLNGHSDLAAGAVAANGAIGTRILHLLGHLGGTLDPHASFLLDRGLKTLALRMRAHNANALALAEWFERHPAIERVHYPGLPSHPHHARARDLFTGCGGVLAIEVAGGLERAQRVLDRLTIPVVGPSLGGVESLISRPAGLSHMTLRPDERQALGITDALLRVSVGVEDVEDLQADFAQALA